MWYKIKRILVGTQQVRPEKIPTSWLLWYRPLQSDLKDISGNGKNGTWQWWTWWFSTVGWKTGARVTESSYLRQYYISTQITTIPWVKTLLGWWYFDYLKTGTYNFECLMWWATSSSNDAYLWMREWCLIGSTTNMSYVRDDDTVRSTGTRYCLAYTQSLTEWKIYLNWNLIKTVSWTYSSNTISSNLLLWAAKYDGQWMSWYIRHCAIYNRSLTDAEVLQFYNNTK